MLVKVKVKKTKANDKGKITFHPKNINWSNLYLGKVPLIHTKAYIIKSIFPQNHIHPGIKLHILKIGNQPPKKRIVIKAEIKIILLYSAKKKNTNTILEYSTYNQKLTQIQPQVNQMVFY
jgi:hypothetical protein